MIRPLSCISLFAAVCLFSCKNAPTQNHGPIIMGDSSTIVTEEDPARLQDLVNDLNPTIPENKDTTETAKKDSDTKPADTAKTAAAEPPKQQQPTAADASGLKADFKDLSVMIPGLAAKISGSGNLQNANGAVYTLTSGSINGNLLKLMGNVTKVSQRYQSVVLLKNDMGTLMLDALSTTTNWEQMKGINNIYRITGLEEKNLEYPDANKGTIQSAVKKAAQRRRYSRKKTEEWLNSVHNVRAVNQKPLYVTLRSVMWKIDGKDANGRQFSKQIRIDLPL